MKNFQLTVPVVLIIFNRVDRTQRVFEEIRKARPSKLLVIADGPRSDRPDDKDKCAKTRAIINNVDWDCEVLTNYSEKNLGCGHRPASGIDWVFDMVEEAIILEDDCLPHSTFFPFCQELLERYRHDSRVMTISGNNFQFGRKRTENSYYFSRYSQTWGWATWRRVWKTHYDEKMKLWPEVREGRWLMDILGDPYAANYWTNIFDSVYSGRDDVWDYQLTFACWMQNGVHVMPNVNLVSNIGVGVDATHTVQASRFNNVPTQKMEFPLKHPAFMIRDLLADMYIQKNNYG